jgi:hypothetical protein
LEGRAAGTAARIAAMAAGMENQGDAGRVAAHSLRCALVTPEGVAALHADGELPVLTLWGLARPGQPRPTLGATADPKAPPAAAAVASVAAATSTTSAETERTGVPAANEAEHPYRLPIEEPPPPPPPRRGLPLVAWVLPAALLGLLLWLLAQALTPLAPRIVEVVEAAPPAPDPAVGPAVRVAELETALREADAAQLRLAAACADVPPPEPPPPQQAGLPEPPPEPPPVVTLPKPEHRVAVLPAAKPPPPPEPPRPEPPPPGTTPPPAAQPAPPPRAACTPTWPPGRSPRVIFVLDGSGSMDDSISGAGSRMEAAKQSIGTVVQSLHKDIRASLVSFSDCYATSRTPFYAAGERSTLLGEVNTVSPQRSTSLAASIKRAGAAAPGRAPSTMVVVSDGGDTCGGDPCAAAQAALAAKPDLTINVIDLSGGNSGGVLECVARAGGGRVFTPTSAGQMATQLQQATGQSDASGCT